MIALQDFHKLKAGDVVLYHGKPRLVMEGPADRRDVGRDGKYITFPIRRRSWTTRAYTTYLYNDVKHALSVVRKQTEKLTRWMCELEVASLASMRFDVVEEMRREVHDDERMAPHNGINRAQRMLKAKLLKFTRRTRR